MSEIGYYRYKTTADVDKEIYFSVDGTIISKKQ
jgi:hypothetical protein